MDKTWFAISERQPMNMDEVLGWNGSSWNRVRYLNDGYYDIPAHRFEWMPRRSPYALMVPNITHWQPLPAPPTDER